VVNKKRNMKTITGNTYPVREQLKRLGGRWNAAVRGWEVPDENAEAAQKLVGGSAPRVRLGSQLWEECERCGTEPSYDQPGGHLCARCAGSDHPRIGTREPENTTEPHHFVGGAA
jgi:hypothetical protein